MYYDIHTHKTLPDVPDVTACYNVIVGRDILPAPAETHPVSCGIHPWYIRVDAWEEQLATFRELARSEQAVMIGEAGLDKKASASLDWQTVVFEEQICFSEEQKKPLVIHCVQAWNELAALRKKWNPSQPWILHGFRRKGEQAAQLVRLGFHLSFGQYFQEAALRAAWPDRLLVETDESNASIREIYQRLASALQIPLAEFVERIEKTVSRLGFLK